MPSPNDHRHSRARLRRLSRVSAFLALSLVLYLVESAVIPPLPVPGAKLGLANLAVLVMIYLEGTGAAIQVALGRVILASLFAGTFGAVAFFPTLAGAVTATFVMAGVRRMGSFGAVGVSISGALAHNLAQLAAIIPFFPRAGLIHFLPYLILLAIPSGLITGLIGDRILKALLPGSAKGSGSEARR